MKYKFLLISSNRIALLWQQIMKLAFVACGLAWPAALGYAAPGDLDPTFGSSGIVSTPVTNFEDRVSSIQVQPDGKIIVTGYSYDYDGWCPCDYVVASFIARYNSSGTLDASFGNNGKIVISGAAVGISTTLQPDGKIVTIGFRYTLNEAGNLALAMDFAVFRYNANGTPDASFGNGGKVFTSVGDGQFQGYYYQDPREVVLQPDGKIIVMGLILVNGSGYKFGIVRYNTDGSLDNSFGTGGKIVTAIATDVGPSSDVNSMLLQPDGKIVLVGSYGSDIILVRYNPDGSLDSGFGVNGKAIHATASYDGGVDSVLQPDGKIVVAGYIGSGYKDRGTEIVRYNPDGSVDTSFAANGIFSTENGFFVGKAIALQPNGKIVGFGYGRLSPGANTKPAFDPQLPSKNDRQSFPAGFSPENENLTSAMFGFAVARLNPDGSPDTSFGASGRRLTPVGTSDNFGLAVAVQADGKILGAGGKWDGSVRGDAAIVRFAGDSSRLSEVTVGGRVLTPDGRGLRNATVTITDSLGIRQFVTTSSFGFYSFGNVRAGEVYTIAVSSRLYRFSPRSVQVDGNLADVDFVGME